MESRNFLITLVSADNVPNIRSSGKMKVYAEVSINGETQTSKRTNVDMVGETNPRWDFPLDYMIAESTIVEEGSAVEVVVKLYCKRTLGDKFIGQVKIPLKSLFDSGIKAVNELSYDVEETEDAKLNILYSFGDMFVAVETKDIIHNILNILGDIIVAADVAENVAEVAETKDASQNAAEVAETKDASQNAAVHNILNSLGDMFPTPEALASLEKVVEVGVEVAAAVMELAEALG